MTPADIRRAICEQIVAVAPDADPSRLRDEDDLRDALDLDSMDFLNVVIRLHERLGVDIPERDYGKLRTMGDAVAYLAARLPR